LIFVHDIGYTDTVIVTLAGFTMMTGVVGAIPRTFLALLTIAIGLGTQAMLVLSVRAAEQLMDPNEYIRAVPSQRT